MKKWFTKDDLKALAFLLIFICTLIIAYAIITYTTNKSTHCDFCETSANIQTAVLNVWKQSSKGVM